MTRMTCRSLFAVIGLAVLVPGLHAADTTYLGPLTVRLVETGADGKSVPIKHSPVWINARHADTDAEGHAVFDGIPAGRHAMKIHLPGFAAIDREIALPAGSRAPVEVVVPRTPPITWNGRLIDRASGLPVVGARVSIRPIAVAAALRGGGQAVTDWDGAFQFVNLSPGRYALSAEAGGFETLSGEYQAGAADPAVPLVMIPLSRPARAELSIVDSRTRQPIAGARVTLAEAWPSGEIAQGTTGNNGRVVFADLKTGAANWPDARGKLLMARQRISARIEADGYAPDVVPLSLGQSIEAALNARVVQPEVEPNDLGAPQEVLTGAPISFAIGSNTDHDAFRFRLAQPGNLVVTVGPGNAIETHLRLRDSDAKLLREQGSHAGHDNRIELRLAAGTYYAEISEWGNNNSAADKPMTLNIEVTPATDPNEPNDSLAQATPVPAGEQIGGLIWPVGDRDSYRIELPRPGMLRILEPGMDMERHVRLLDRDGKLLSEQGAHGNNGIDFSQRVESGSHLLDIMEWGNNNASLTPYRLRLIYMPDDAIDDPPIGQGSLSAKRSLSLPETVHATLMPRGDIDLYSIPLAGAGTLQVRSQGDLERHVQIFNRAGKLLTEQGVHGHHENWLSWQVDGPDTLFVAIREWGDNHYSPTPYALSAWFEPADEFDFLQRNDDFDHATPIAPGETVRGSYDPRGDRDVFVLEADFPGILRVKAKSGLETHLRIYDSQRKLVTEQGVHGDHTAQIAPNVAAGLWYIMIGEWGDNNAGTIPYELSAELERAEPGEAWPMTSDPPRRLVEGVAQAFSIDHNNDIDRFVFDLARPAGVNLSLVAPIEIHLRVYDDQTGKLIHESGHHAPAQASIPLDFKTPVRLRIELMEWGQNNASFKSGFVMVDSRGRAVSSARVSGKAPPDDPLRVAFSRENLERGDAASRCDIDINRDGRAELSVSGDSPRDYRFPEAGLYDVESVCQGNNGTTSRQRLWVQTTLPREKRGIALFLPAPAQGQALSEAIDLRAHAMSYDGKRIARVDFNLDGRRLASDYTAPFETTPTWQSLAAGQHSLVVTAWDDAGNKAEVKRQFVLSEFFGLTPSDGAVLTGENVRVTWTGQAFGDSRVRYRIKGSEAWLEAVGQSGRQRIVTLAGLEAGKPYEFQPVGASEGPLRSVTRVKGLAFSEARYGANIRRDYDQKVGISVRNNGDKPLKVRLECGKPADPLLLVGFVGEGSEDKPIDLGPGESRQFVLGLSAQDVVSAEHRFPVRIVSDTGLSDEAEVAVQVKLPRVELVWEDKGAAPGGQGRLYRLVNQGDNLTDLAVSAADPDKVSIYPTVRHGLLQAGQAQEFTVTPQYYEGFTGVDTRLIARALNKPFEQTYSMQLAPGESARRIWLFPGDSTMDAESERAAIANAEQAKTLNPASIDWSRHPDPEDTDQDGQPDRWSQRIGKVLWVGDDSDTDGQVDFVHADVGDDGVFEYSAWKDQSGWRPTNLVEAWLEMGFTLPWSRDSYKEHDAEIVLNGVVIGRLKDRIPEGNFTFRIPPKALKFDAAGRPAENQVGIHSKHLRGGHYVINSDFRFKFRLTATPVWTVAKSEAEARTNAAKLTGVSVGAPDFSVSSAEMRLIGPASPKAGEAMQVEFVARNLGASAPAGVAIVLSRSLPSGTREELARSVAMGIPLSGPTTLRIPFKARGGGNTLVVSIDPDKQFPDSDPANNSASLFLQVAGDSQLPELRVTSPSDGQSSTDGLIAIDATATDDQGVAGLYLSIDGGLWQDLQATDGIARRTMLLQPGEHRLVIKAVDYSDNVTERKLAVHSSAAPAPLRVTAPVNGARIDARVSRIQAEVDIDTSLVAARAAGGPWYRAIPEAGRAMIDLPLKFGAQTLEIMAANKNGIVASHSLRVDCTRQPDATEDSLAPASENGLVWPVSSPGMAIDLFKGSSGLLAKTDPEARERLQRSHEAAQALEREASRLEEADAARLALEQRTRIEAEAESRRLEENARQAQLAEAAAALRAREMRDQLARQEASQRQNDEAARLALEEELRRTREEAERLRQELELERSRKLQGGRDYTAATPVMAPIPVPVATPVPAPWPGTQGTAVGQGQPATPAQTGMLLFEVDSARKVKNRPDKASKFELEAPHVITQIRTRHWNGGLGAAPGSIGLRCRDDKTYGPWQAIGMPDAKGVANAYWVVYPNLALDAGVCAIVDSDPGTWSHNDDTKKRGIVRVEGYPDKAAKRIAPPPPDTGKEGYIEQTGKALGTVDETLNTINKLLDLFK